MKNFSEFEKVNKLIIEMPHIPLDNAEPIDLELEVHDKMKPDEYIQYFKDWLDGKPVKSKMGFVQKLPKTATHEFADAILNQWNYTKLFTIKYYGQSTWSKLEKLLHKYL